MTKIKNMQSLLKLTLLTILYFSFSNCTKKDVTGPGLQQVTLPNLTNTRWEGNLITKVNMMSISQRAKIYLYEKDSIECSLENSGGGFSSLPKGIWQVKEFAFSAQIIVPNTTGNKNDTINFLAPISRIQLSGLVSVNNELSASFSVQKL